MLYNLHMNGKKEMKTRSLVDAKVSRTTSLGFVKALIIIATREDPSRGHLTMA